MSESTDEKKEDAGEKEAEGDVKEEAKAETASSEKAGEKPKKASAKKAEKPTEKAKKEAAEEKEEKPAEKDAEKSEKEQKEKPVEKAKDGGKGKMTKEDVISYIESMSVLELSEMIKELQDKFGVTAAPIAAAVAAAPAAGGDAAAAEEKTEFDVVLSAAGDKKIQVIKEVRAITGLSLKDAKDLVDGAPKPVKEKASKEEADKIKAQLEGAGATVELK